LNTSKYERVYQPALGDYRETHLCFIEGTRLTGVREVVHHKDLDKRNNAPDNLQWMTRKDHVDLHKEIRNKFNEKLRTDPEFYKEWHSKMKAGLKKYYETHDSPRKGVVLSDETKKKCSESKIKFFQTEEGEKLKEHLREKAIQQFKDQPHPNLGKKCSEAEKEKMRGPRPQICGDNNPSRRPDAREKLREAWVRRRQKNHKIVDIEILDIREDCYDLSVETYHNFAVSAGVFVHNCMLPNFGTPLRELIFEPNDATIATRAKQMIINSITEFEPRITVDAIDVSTSIDPNSLNPSDNRDEINHILSIKIAFFDPRNIQEVQELKLELPLGGA
jgi:tRNA-splicing ligase RtcB